MGPLRSNIVISNIVIAIFASCILLACAPRAGPSTTTLNRGNGGEPKSLDPHYTDITLEDNIVGDMFMGLTTEDRAGNPIPGAAQSWTISTDGRTWTFRLRPHRWSDGVPVTSHDFALAWRRILDPNSAAHYSYMLWIFRNAHAISDGRLPPSALGVETPRDDTLVVHLEHPAPYLPELLTHETMYPLPEHAVKKFGAAWATAGHYVSNGAYMLKEWQPGDHITLVKNPLFYDARHVRIEAVNFFPTVDTDAALARMRAGQLDTQNPLPAMEIGWLRTHMADALRIDPLLGISCILINLERPPLDDRRIREALNLAVDRETLVEKVFGLGESAAYGIIPKGTANYPRSPALDFTNLPYPQRIARAQALMHSAGYSPEKRLHLSFETFTDPDGQRSAAALQDMLRAIYVDIDIVATDIQIHYVDLQQHNFELAGFSWVADFNDATNFLDLFRWDGGKNNNYGNYHNPAYDALLDAAQQKTDLNERGRLLRQAEQIVITDYATIPVRFLVTRDLVAPYVKGWVSNARDVNRTRWLWIEGRPPAA